MRTEQEIFDSLAKLCASPGYVHVIAYLCIKNFTFYQNKMTADDMRHLFSPNRLIRTEISTLIGLFIKQKVDYTLPDPSVMQEYVDKTRLLLKELHQLMLSVALEGLDPENPAFAGQALREPIFYGGESAYSFQYRDLAPRKYARDDDWLKANKGFSIQTARDIAHAVVNIQNEKSTGTPIEGTFLPVFTVTSREVAEWTGIDRAIVEKILISFSVPVEKSNEDFCKLNDFNMISERPLIRYGTDSFILFQQYDLLEALYDAPFYWMCKDTKYKNIAMHNRGRFTEEFCRERLELVFGKENVHSNVDIFRSGSTKLGEIDVLVLFGDRVIILQAKSKRLTLESRKGNDGQIKDDFKKSVQDAYDQGYTCAKALIDGTYQSASTNSKEIKILNNIKELYILCVVSDHYPALSFQALQFLRFEKNKTIHPPFVMDVFMLDTMTEMLQSPLRLLSYISRRTKYSNKLISSHERMIFAGHLKYNLWVDNEQDLVTFDDKVSDDLENAMIVRREGIPGEPTPEGILTRFGTMTLGNIVKEIEASQDPATIDLGCMLLTLSENTVLSVSEGIDRIVSMARRDGKRHDFTVSIREGKSIGEGSTGLTIHCNNDPVSVAFPRLYAHCATRKSSHQADSWFGLCLSPENAILRFGLNLDERPNSEPSPSV
ncbi:MAG: nuclease-related domain-containing protein [Nitrospira sp.]|nr:nuclease-related domain-containing protein [Nitrospira sp.]